MMYTSPEKGFLSTREKLERKQKQVNTPSRSRYYSPDSKSTSSQFSQTKAYDISIQSIVSVIDKVKQQNEYLSFQKDLINKQMQQLDNLTNILVKQNQALRKHLQQRTADIGEVVKSISVNTKHNMQDTQYLLLSYKGHNSLLAKKINEIKLLNAQVQQNISFLQSELKNLNLQNATIQKNLKNGQAKSLKTKQKINKQKSGKTILDLRGLQQQVCNLTVQTSIIKKQNLQLIHLLKNQKNQVQLDKPTFKNGTIQAIKGMNSLKQQIDQIKTDYRRMQTNYESSNANNQSILSKIIFYQRQNQQKTRKISQQASKLKKIEEAKTKLIQEIKTLNDKRMSRMNIRNELDKQLQLYEQNKWKIITAYQMKQKQIEKQKQGKINEIKQNCEMVSKKLQEQLINNLIPIKIHNKETISKLKQQSLQLKSKVKQLQNALKPKAISSKATTAVINQTKDNNT